jgi:hypothetical protein
MKAKRSKKSSTKTKNKRSVRHKSNKRSNKKSNKRSNKQESDPNLILIKVTESTNPYLLNHKCFLNIEGLLEFIKDLAILNIFLDYSRVKIYIKLMTNITTEKLSNLDTDTNSINKYLGGNGNGNGNGNVKSTGGMSNEDLKITSKIIAHLLSNKGTNHSTKGGSRSKKSLKNDSHSISRGFAIAQGLYRNKIKSYNILKCSKSLTSAITRSLNSIMDFILDAAIFQFIEQKKEIGFNYIFITKNGVYFNIQKNQKVPLVKKSVSTKLKYD